jgi:hypothetical protein
VRLPVKVNNAKENATVPVGEKSGAYVDVADQSRT